MSSVLDEMRAVLEGNEDELMHYGTKYHSGRYPYGSGEDPYQHGGDFLTRIDRLKKEEGFTETAENVKKFLSENPDICNEIEEKIRHSVIDSRTPVPAAGAA